MPRLKPPPEMVDLHARAFAAGFTMTDVLRRAGVALSTWTRMREHRRPLPETMQKLNAALFDLIAEDEAAKER